MSGIASNTEAFVEGPRVPARQKMDQMLTILLRRNSENRSIPLRRRRFLALLSQWLVRSLTNVITYSIQVHKLSSTTQPPYNGFLGPVLALTSVLHSDWTKRNRNSATYYELKVPRDDLLL